MKDKASSVIVADNNEARGGHIFMSKSIAQDMVYRQSLMKYAKEYGVRRASQKYNIWCFIEKGLTPPHLPHIFVRERISALERLEPLLHRFVSQSRHTHHRYFIDPRHIGHTIHLWTAFHISITPCLGDFLPTSPGFRHQPFGLRLPEYQGRRFRALPHHSTFWIISSTKKFSFLVPNLFS